MLEEVALLSFHCHYRNIAEKITVAVINRTFLKIKKKNLKSFDCSEKPHEPHGVYQEIILCQVNNVEKPSTNVMTLDIDDVANSIQTIDYVCRTETQSGNGSFDLFLIKNQLKLKN